ncbi:hypothetical protein GGI12_003468 [Dipsacomyces acuminosporus]|nr:hypothetical protein GGI12_003468 [Dipsacomyces acuminosporus]
MIQGDEGGESAHVLEPVKYNHTIRVRHASEGSDRASGVAFNAITARSAPRGMSAQAMPNSMPTSRIISSDESMAEILASANTDLVNRHNSPGLPGLEGFSTPATCGAPLSHTHDNAQTLHMSLKLVLQNEDTYVDGQHARITSADELYKAAKEQYEMAMGTISTSYDSPVSDTGTGKTQILDFAEASIHDQDSSAIRQRRPSARPEIKEISRAIWGDADPAADAAASSGIGGDIEKHAVLDNADVSVPSSGNKLEQLALQAHKGPSTGEHGNASNSPNTLGIADASTPPPPEAQSESARLAVDKDKDKNKEDDVAMDTVDDVSHDPSLLAKLVQSSSDPRSLIYDAGSQFGSMRSKTQSVPGTSNQPANISSMFDQDVSPAAPSTEVPESKESYEATTEERILETFGSGDVLLLTPAVAADTMESETKGEAPPEIQMPAREDSPKAEEQARDHETTAKEASPTRSTLHYQLHQADCAAESDALAHASVQATHSGESPAIPAKNRHTAANAANSAQPGIPAGRRVSLQEYVEQQKPGSRSRLTNMGHEQLNFRVSLLQRKPSERSRKMRSVSLPSPQSAPPALLSGMLPPVLMAQDAAHQRTHSFYETPALAQALGQPALVSQSANHPHSWPPAIQALGVTFSEDITERALFSQILGDGAALTPRDLKDAKRHSGGIPLLQPAPPLFDPAKDTGEDGVPESVLRAYLAGDLTAIERFFAHVMRLTAPSSIYDGEVSDDGDWIFGLEGPPPEVLAQREATKKQQEETPKVGQSQEDRAAQDTGAAATGDAGHADKCMADGLQQEIKVGEPLVARKPEAAKPAAEVSGTAQSAALPSSAGLRSVGGDSAADSHSPRRIAIPKSRLLQARRSKSKGSSIAEDHQGSSAVIQLPLSSSELSGSASAQQFDTIMPGAIQAPKAAPAAQQILGSSSGVRSTIEEPNTADANCYSPARGGDRNRRHSEARRRKPIPGQTGKEGNHEKLVLMARLRVLEGMIQKAAIKESRLQPEPALLKPQLLEDMESMASIYSSSIDFGYDAAYTRPSNNQRQRSHRHRTDNELVSRSSLMSGSQHSRTSYEDPAGNRRTGQPPVLEKLRQNARMRTSAPYRASMLNRAFSPSGYSTESIPGAAGGRGKRDAKARNGGTLDTIQSNEAGEIAYSAKSSGSIKIELVEESMSIPSQVPELPSNLRILPFAETARFRRTARLLSSS